jgi:sugar/nucleoside kinase (ribokinase family)
MLNSYPANAKPVLVVGSVAFDSIQTPTTETGIILGGSASYGAIAASYFAPTQIVGVVGNDFGEEYIERLRKQSIDLTGLQRDNSGKTFFWSGIYGENFATRETIETQLNVFEHFDPTLPPSYRGSPYVMLGNIHPSLQHRVLDQMANRPFIAADTMNLWIDISRDDLITLLPRLDLFVLNDDEAPLLTGEQNPILAGEKILTMGPKSVLIKKGPHGALLFHPDGYFTFPAYPVTNLQDPTGAGDSFLGALMGYLASIDKTDFASLKKAVVYGTVTASITVEAFSCDSLEKTNREAIEKRFSELLSYISLG